MATAPLPAIEGSLDFRCDVRGIFRVTGTGFWTVSQVDRHFRALEAALVAARQEGGQVRALVDLREAAVQSPETAARISAATKRIYLPGDRIAIIVATSLARMQIRRVVDSRLHEIFLCDRAGEDWLQA